MKTILPTNFIYPDIKPNDLVFGKNEVVGEILRPDGDWRNFLPPEEIQKRNGIESSACFCEAQQHAIATILEEQYWDADNNYSARFNALLSGGTEYGGNPLECGQSIRHDGLVKETTMPFDDSIQSWSDYHSFKGVNELTCRAEGLKWLTRWKPNYSIVFTREHTLEEKYSLLREALKRSPVPISVCGVVDETGNYIQKLEGMVDTHMVLAVYVDNNNCIHIRDTYPSFNKILPPNYNPDFGMSWVVTRLEMVKKRETVFDILKRLFIRFMVKLKLLCPVESM